MKRLNLKDFTKKQRPTAKTSDQLLGQVLGDCHDGHSSGGNGGGYNVGDLDTEQGF